MTQQYIDAAVADFEKTVAHLHDEFSRLQVGRANPALVESVMIDAYGSSQPLKNMANISVPDSKTLQIQPWDKSVMGAIEKGILQANLGLNPVNNGAGIIISIPALTEERRKDLVKVVHKLAEDAKISIRNARQVAHAKFKSLSQDKEITEDEVTGAEKQLQTKVDEYNGKVVDAAKAKEEGVMTV
jgi:ribosome recycling factor